MSDYFEPSLDCRDCGEEGTCGMYLDTEEQVMNGITKDTFRTMDTDSKLEVLFDYMHEIVEKAPRRVRDRDIKCAKQVMECNKKFESTDNKFEEMWNAIKRNRILNTGAAFAGGCAGGATAIISYLKFFV